MKPFEDNVPLMVLATSLLLSVSCACPNGVHVYVTKPDNVTESEFMKRVTAATEASVAPQALRDCEGRIDDTSWHCEMRPLGPTVTGRWTTMRDGRSVAVGFWYREHGKAVCSLAASVAARLQSAFPTSVVRLADAFCPRLYKAVETSKQEP